MKFYWEFAGLIAMMIVIGFSACRPSLKDVSNQDPYREAIGKKFSLQRDLYIYQMNESRALEIGPGTDMSQYSIGVPSEVNEKHIGLNTHHLTIKGIAKTGQNITIQKILYKQDYYFPYGIYYIALEGHPQFSLQEIDAGEILNSERNPPKTEGWSTPPIFKADMALPLASDGVWWK